MLALNTMMSGIAKATRYIAGFTAGLFGTTYKQAAEATQKLKNTGKTVTDTAKKVNLSLAGIDEMNILSDNSDESENNEENSGIDFSNLDMSEPKLPPLNQPFTALPMFLPKFIQSNSVTKL